MTLDEHILEFYQKLTITVKLPAGVSYMNPYQDKIASDLAKQFYKKFYGDNHTRTLILGINPGRFGGGVTGIPFTDPIRLTSACGIDNQLKKKAELSSEFIYKMIEAFGGAQKFYRQFFISAVSPLGFVKDGKNLNYYDIKELQVAVEPFMIKSIKEQLDFGINRERCFCLGEGKNFEYLTGLNKKEKFFNEIIPLAHPRFIMQYKRKTINLYIKEYVTKLQ